ncbi:hypothetical protein HS125_04535 [bacterium]|nr:hypothetical protein [bacterium]
MRKMADRIGAERFRQTLVLIAALAPSASPPRARLLRRPRRHRWGDPCRSPADLTTAIGHFLATE